MRRLATLTLLVLVSASTLHTQSKPALTRADYGQWESVAAGAARGGFSPDGRWMAYSISRSDRTSELRILKLPDGAVKTAATASQAVYSSDSAWLAYSVGYTEAEQEKMRADRRPIQNKLGLMNLATSEMTSIDGVQTFAFSGDGKFLAMKRYSSGTTGIAGTTGATGTADSETPALGSTLIVRTLATGRDTTFGNVGEFAWQDGDSSHLLALAISAEGMTGNGVHLFDPSSTVLRVLDSANAGYSTLVWRKDSGDLALLKSKADATRETPAYIAMAWRQLGSTAERRLMFDATSSTGVPADMRVVTFRRPSWSDDGKVLFVGIADWTRKRTGTTGTTGTAGTTGTTGTTGATGTKAEKDELASVDVWHWTDTSVMARQKLSLAQDRRRNLLSAWHVDAGTFVPLAKNFNEQVSPVPHSTSVYVEDWDAYAMDRSIGRPAADLYLADLTTGARTKLKDRVDDGTAQVSPGGKYVLFLQNDHYWTIDLTTRAVTNITKAVATSFINRESDATVAQKPSFGVAGWTKNDEAVLLYDQFDIWQVQPTGARATKLTNGAADQTRIRLVRVDPDQEFVDLAAPNYVSLFGAWSKKSGYGVWRPDAGVERVLFGDKAMTGLAKARAADAFAYIAQGHDDSPDVFLTNATLQAGRQVTTTNPFQDKFAWSRSEVVEFQTAKGQRLQGALYYPAGYEPGKRYPMIVYLYEKLSDNVHRYVAPSDRDYYNTTVFTSQGYFVLQPDIVFRPRDPGLSVVDCVTPAVQKVVQTGMVDGTKVGVIGHSWGGFDTAFLATHTDKVFAAAVAGAPITDLVSNYGNHHWSSGIAETDHIETGQQRMEVPLYDDLPAYIRNSAVFNVQKMTVPLLVEVGDADGTVYWHQGVELYNIARRAKKNVVMLVYGGEDHGLRQKKNQVDYQRRILEWFGHYLQGQAAQPWISQGVTALQREKDVKEPPTKGGGH